MPRARSVKEKILGRYTVRLMDNGLLHVILNDAAEDEEEQLVPLEMWPRSYSGPRVVIGVVKVDDV